MLNSSFDRAAKEKDGKLKNRAFILFDFILMRVGYFNSYKKINTEGIKRLVFVCKGNVCRSVYCEFFIKQRLINSTNDLEVVSCGLRTSGGTKANNMATKVAKIRNVNLSLHRSRRATDIAINNSDLVIIMEPGMAIGLRSRGIKVARKNIVLLGMIGSSPQVRINDPYGKSEKAFNVIFDQVEDKVKFLLKHFMLSR